MDHLLLYLCLVFDMLSRLYIAAVWSSAGKGLTSGLTFACGILGQVLYLIVSFPDHCRLSYLDIFYRLIMCLSCRRC